MSDDIDKLMNDEITFLKQQLSNCLERDQELSLVEGAIRERRATIALNILNYKNKIESVEKEQARVKREEEATKARATDPHA